MSTTQANGPTIARNQGIDALRGMSILLVVIHHIGIRIALAKTALATFLPKWLLSGLNWNGAEAVVIFFVISGFLITRRSHERWGELSNIPARRFYLLRVARILPTLLLLIALLSMFHLLGVPSFVIDRAGQSLAGAIASALGLYLNWYEAATGYLPGGWDVLWSLSIEELFYLVFPLACLALGRTRLFVPALLLLALSLPFTRAALEQQHNELWMEKAYLPGMAAIATGVLAALLVRRIAAPSRTVCIALCAFGLLGIGAIFFAGGFVWSLLHHGYGLLLTLSAASLVLGLHWIETITPHFHSRGLGWLRSCGRLSYEIYLFHMFCVFAVVAVAKQSTLDAQWSFVWYVPGIALSWLLGMAVARGFSQPVERWLRTRNAAPNANVAAAVGAATA